MDLDSEIISNKTYLRNRIQALSEDAVNELENLLKLGAGPFKDRAELALKILEHNGIIEVKSNSSQNELPEFIGKALGGALGTLAEQLGIKTDSTQVQEQTINATVIEVKNEAKTKKRRPKSKVSSKELQLIKTQESQD